MNTVGTRFVGLIKSIEATFRQRRYQILVNLLSDIGRPLSILDVGGTVEFWLNYDYRNLGDVRITLLNIFDQRDLPCGFKSVVGDARNLSIYKSKVFDLVFSNSVIGHVGSLEEQRKMANEIMRVGKRIFLQTPNKNFPIDWRTLVPFFHFLPIKYQAWCFRHFRVGMYKRVANYESSMHLTSRIRTLTRYELIQLFPASTLISDRFLCFT